MSVQDNDLEPSQILEHVFLGSKTHARNKELLQRLKITPILNVTPSKKIDPLAGVPNYFSKDQHFIYRRCAIFDNKAEDLLQVLEGCIAVIDEAKYYGRILVHCNKGVSRSSSMVVAYLMKLQSMSFEQALAFVVKRRSIANPNETFRLQLQEYGRRLSRCMPMEKTIRVVRGPIGPQLPTSEKQKQECATAIGPQLPLPLMQAQDDENTGMANIKVGMRDDKEKMIIGPNLPPCLKREHVQTIELNGDNTTSMKKRKKTESSD